VAIRLAATVNAIKPYTRHWVLYECSDADACLHFRDEFVAAEQCRSDRESWNSSEPSAPPACTEQDNLSDWRLQRYKLSQEGSSELPSYATLHKSELTLEKTGLYILEAQVSQKQRVAKAYQIVDVSMLPGLMRMRFGLAFAPLALQAGYSYHRILLTFARVGIGLGISLDLSLPGLRDSVSILGPSIIARAPITYRLGVEASVSLGAYWEQRFQSSNSSVGIGMMLLYILYFDLFPGTHVGIGGGMCARRLSENGRVNGITTLSIGWDY
jgi:hypothetical protein